MKNSRLFKVLAVAVVLALLMLAIPATPAMGAVGTITITSPVAKTGSPGTAVTLSCQNFTPNQTYTITFGGTAITTGNTGTTGTFNAAFSVPVRARGSYQVTMTTTGPDSSNIETFIITPEVTLDDDDGYVGDTVTVSGSGFDGSSNVTIYFDSTSVGSATTNTSGTLAATTITVPSTSRGSHTVKVQDAGANYATATFTVSAKITINPPSGPSGTTVTVTGTGFAASVAVTITYNNISVTTVPPSVTTNSTGGFSATFSVPVFATGTYEVKATAGADTATANFQSTTDATINQTTTTAAPGNVGMSLTITGVGFTPNHEVTVSYSLSATESVDLTTVTSGATGSFTAPFTIPPSIGGAHTITVSDDTITKTFDFVMESNAPPTPEMTLPLADTKLKDKLFEWEAVEDVSPKSAPISYDLQVASDDSFSSASLLLDKTGLTTASYTLLDEEELESTGEEAPYYWRVRAVDAASNASAWSEPSPFTVGWSFEFSGWVVWVTMVVIAIVFFFLGLWLGRRAGGGEYF